MAAKTPRRDARGDPRRQRLDDAKRASSWENALLAAKKNSATGSGGNVRGMTTSSDGEVVLYSGSSGKKIKTSSLQITDLGNVFGPASATDADFAQYDGVTGKLLKDGGYSPSSFVTPADLAASYQRSERRVLSGATRTVPTWTSDTIVGPFYIDDTGIITIEDEAVLQLT